MDFSRWHEIHQQQQQQQQHHPSYAQLYNAPQSYIPYAYYPSNPNPNSSDQTDSSGPDTGLRPPGVDPHTPNPYAPHGGYVGLGEVAAAAYGHPQQAMQPEAVAYFHDPNNGQLQNWASDPYAVAPEFVPLNGMEQMVGANPNTMVWNNQMINNPFVRGKAMNRSLKKTKTKTKVVQSAWCELCKVDCNSQDILNTHKVGKKHMKNLKKLEESKNVVATEHVTTTKIQDLTMVKEVSSGESAKSKKMWRKRTSASKPEEDLETKRQKLMECGTTVDSLRVCTVCDVVCNSETVFNLHLVGQKHAAKVANASNGMEPTVGPNPNPIPNPVTRNDRVSLTTVNGTTKKKKKKKKIEKTEVAKPVWCELCMIDCSTQEVLDKHKLGKRHMKTLEKLAEFKNAAAAVKLENAEVGTKESPAGEKTETTKGKGKRKKKGASTYKPGEDLETKKRKILECGTTADSVKVCTVCNVVCNSETVYNYHLAGQKHATLVKKQTTAIIKSVPGPQPVSSTTATSTVSPQPASAATVTPTVAPQTG